jgi:nitronate monooxygenase
MTVHSPGLPPAIASRLRLPLIAAPMLRVSGPQLVTAACRAGVVGAFPTVNARSTAELSSWLDAFDAASRESGGTAAPYCANLIIRHARVHDDLACLVDHRVEMVITSVGSPASVVGPLHDVGALVLADVATLAHAEKAVAAGVDGLVLLSAGAGGQTGWLNPFAFVRAVRAIFDGIVVLAGGMSDGAALYAATVLGCDLCYMGTKFIATSESMADARYKEMLVDSTIDDVYLTRALTGIPANVLEPSIRQNGIDPKDLDESVSGEAATDRFSSVIAGPGPKRWVDIWSAGHSVSGVAAVATTSEVVNRTASEFDAARAASARRICGH